MILQNGTVFMGDGRFLKADVRIEGERIIELATAGCLGGEGVVDAEGKYVLPGFIDIHTHGAAGYDFCDADPAGYGAILRYYGGRGVTSVVPATMSYPEEKLAGILRAAGPFFGMEGHGAVLRGVNMEGPFLNKTKCGAQNPDYIEPPQFDILQRLQTLAEGHIRFVDIAPEEPGAIEFTKKASALCRVSLAHTAADFDTATEAFQAGASHVTHLFNAMPPFLHRSPGVVGAAFDRAAHVELISDGLHLHPAVVRAAFALFGPRRICLISDSMRAAGMPNGRYDLGGQPVLVHDGKATLADNPAAIAGSVVPLDEMCRRAISFGVPMEQAVLAATANNAEAAGLQGEVGSIAPGKRADVVLWDAGYQNTGVLCGGVWVGATA